MDKSSVISLRPRGRSGLKYTVHYVGDRTLGSPSSRAEWVEIKSGVALNKSLKVSVLAGGVG